MKNLAPWLLGASLWALAACGGSSNKPAASAERDENAAPPRCERDEVREYFCDTLLPLSSDDPAPEPYETCPGSIDVRGNTFVPTREEARFDVARTEWTRRRVPPGQSCCYSWCAKLVVASPDDADQAACTQPRAMRETLCVNEAEAGVSDAAAAPYQACAAALTPPAKVAFSAPKAALLDVGATGERRSQGLKECCYGWCSTTPLGTGLGQAPNSR
jgi:hypothetical protein